MKVRLFWVLSQFFRFFHFTKDKDKVSKIVILVNKKSDVEFENEQKICGLCIDELN